jgi:hypothetical protein
MGFRVAAQATKESGCATLVRAPVQHRRYDKLSPRRLQELAPAAQEAMGFRVAAQATKESGCATLVRAPVQLSRRCLWC